MREYFVICKKYEPHGLISIIMGLLFFILLCFFGGYFGDDLVLLFTQSLSFMTAQILQVYLLWFLIILAFMMFLVLFAIEVFSQKPNNSIGRISVSFVGAFFFPLVLSFMVYIRQMYYGAQYIFLFFVTVWILDTAAFAVGKKYGKRKLSATISPKKTIEGALAGIVFAMLTSALIGVKIFGVFNFWQAIVLGFAIAITGQFSDLAESLIKRDADIKDSGTIIPGHGGVLDRFDSYFFAAPIIYCLLTFLQGSGY
jgi:phosphatidate cytidylyltransferase